MPFRPETAAEFKAYFEDTVDLPSARAFPGMWQGKGCATLREDLAAAGIPYETDEGVVDFHALRHSFITMLARSGIHPSVAQALARHSDINLTMSRYTHTLLESQAEALSALPDLTAPASEDVDDEGDESAIAKPA